MSAGIATPHARTHPSRRMGIAEGSAGRVTGRTNVSRGAHPAIAKYGLITLENRTTKATTPMTPAPSHTF